MRFWSISGLVPYESARGLQRQMVELRAAEIIPNIVLLLEHEPVITRGRGLQKNLGAETLQHSNAQNGRQMPLAAVLPEELSYSETERGGDLTYHGPGQLVIYPILKLDGSAPCAPHHSVTGYIREFEKVICDVLADYGLKAEARESATGVWVGNKKIASIGISVRKWVTFHGVAINCVNSLQPFHLFSPCGFRSEVMTRLADLVPETLYAKDWRATFEDRFTPRFGQGTKEEGMLLEPMSWEEAQARVRMTIDENYPIRLEDAEAPAESSDSP